MGTLGIFDVTEVSYVDAADVISDSSRNDISKLRQQMAAMESQIDRYKSLNDKLESALDTCVEEKNALEQTMLSEFLPILNSKKREIKRLMKRNSKNSSDKSLVTSSNSSDNDTSLE